MITATYAPVFHVFQHNAGERLRTELRETLQHLLDAGVKTKVTVVINTTGQTTVTTISGTGKRLFNECSCFLLSADNLPDKGKFISIFADVERPWNRAFIEAMNKLYSLPDARAGKSFLDLYKAVFGHIIPAIKNADDYELLWNLAVQHYQIRRL